MLFERIESEGLAHYSYLVGDDGEAIVIDPRRDCSVYVERTARRGYRIVHVLEAHRNEDFIVGSVELAARSGADVWHADAQWDYEYGR
jgi:hydroxyacylglutathione hydrolase